MPSLGFDCQWYTKFPGRFLLFCPNITLTSLRLLRRQPQLPPLRPIPLRQPLTRLNQLHTVEPLLEQHHWSADAGDGPGDGAVHFVGAGEFHCPGGAGGGEEGGGGVGGGPGEGGGAGGGGGGEEGGGEGGGGEGEEVEGYEEEFVEGADGEEDVLGVLVGFVFGGMEGRTLLV